MLLKLNIKNFALITDISIDFKEGLNILTGETGAGKSIIIDAINLIIGQRASSEYIRSGKEKALIEAIFQYKNKRIDEILGEYGIETEGDIVIISREITTQYRNYCRLNGKSVPLSVLKKVSKYLVDIHGQHQHQSLFDRKNHIKLLDGFGGKDLSDYKLQVKKSYLSYKDAKKQYDKFQKKHMDLAKQKSKYEYELEEIEKAQLKPQEDKKLQEQKEVMQNAEEILVALEKSYDLLYSGIDTPSIMDNLNNVIDVLKNIESVFCKVSPIIEVLQNNLYELEDIKTLIRDYKYEMSFDSESLDLVIQRLDLIENLKMKYNRSIQELLTYKEEISNKLDEDLNLESKIKKLSLHLEDAKNQLTKVAIMLSKQRKRVAKKLEAAISKELEDLGMKNVKFIVSFGLKEDDDGFLINGKKVKVDNEGYDDIEFKISTNIGEPLKPLAKIVSGGEASRIMLALKSILAKTDNIPCLIFDEIDAGIGGRAAQIVGEKLSLLAETHQILSVTHSPQIASLGDNHFLIKKHTKGKSTYTDVFCLDEKHRINELARMLGGAKITENTLTHAKEMIKMANSFKTHQKAL